MSWTDKKSIEVIKYLRDKFKSKIFIETGTFMGVNAELHSKNFEEVWTCELNEEYYNKACERFNKINPNNIYCFPLSSPDFLKQVINTHPLKDDINIIYLDAHFYDPKMPKGKGKFVILKELKAMKGWNNCIIIIHDFANGLGAINYDGIDLDFDLLEKDLKKVNPNFHYYTNTLKGCDIVKNNKEDIEKAGLPYDEEVKGNLEYAWREPRLTYRGILYCLPKSLNKNELKELGLRKWGKI